MTATVIPKVVHTCWFGDHPKSEKVKSCLASQRVMLPDYEFIEWNEHSCDLDEFPFLRHAYDGRQFAHLSDMVRLLALKRHGGIYFDTDVEVIRPLTDLLGAGFFIGYMWDCNLGTAVIGSRPDHPVVNGLLENYTGAGADVRFDIPNNDLVTRHFIDNVEGFRLDGQPWRARDIHVLDKYAFEHPSLGRGRNYALHHFEASWKNEAPLKRTMKSLITKSMGLYLYRKYICSKSLRISPFRDEYEAARKRA